MKTTSVLDSRPLSTLISESVSERSSDSMHSDHCAKWINLQNSQIISAEDTLRLSRPSSDEEARARASCVAWPKTHSYRDREDWDLTVTLPTILLIFALFLQESQSLMYPRLASLNFEPIASTSQVLRLQMYITISDVAMLEEEPNTSCTPGRHSTKLSSNPSFPISQITTTVHESGYFFQLLP